MMNEFTPAGRPTSFLPSPWAKGDDKTCMEIDAEGRPTLRLEWWERALWLVDSHDLVVPCDRRGLSRLGLHGFGVRGVKYYKAEARNGDFSPGKSVVLSRDALNPHDKNAIQVRAQGSSQPAGFVNKQKAATLAKLLDRNDDLVAICLRGAPPGTMPEKIAVLVSKPDLLTHLMRNLNRD